MERILVSGCLIGQRVRFDGRAKPSHDAAFQRWLGEGRLVPVCPEVAGGLPVPRPPAEIVGTPGMAMLDPPSGMPSDRPADGAAVLDGNARVLTAEGTDVTACFVRGAEHALAVARRFDVKMAVLKETSPSCASHRLHDGGFTGRHVGGLGVTTALLERNGVRVFSEEECDAAEAHLADIEESALP